MECVKFPIPTAARVGNMAQALSHSLKINLFSYLRIISYTDLEYADKLDVSNKIVKIPGNQNDYHIKKKINWTRQAHLVAALCPWHAPATCAEHLFQIFEKLSLVRTLNS